MSSLYEEYRKCVEKYVAEHATLIREVCGKDVPQHILWKKEVSAAIEKELGGTYTVTKAVGGFFFKELLVNKLMYFAYLQGAKDIEQRSHRRGWDDCRESMLKKMGAWSEESE